MNEAAKVIIANAATLLGDNSFDEIYSVRRIGEDQHIERNNESVDTIVKKTDKPH